MTKDHNVERKSNKKSGFQVFYFQEDDAFLCLYLIKYPAELTVQKH